MSSDYWWYHSCETDLGRNLVYPLGAQRVWLSLVRQVHVSSYNSEQSLGIGMGRTRDMMAEIAEAVEDVRQTDCLLSAKSGRASRQHTVELSLSASTATATFTFNCSSAVPEPCGLVLVHLHPLLCAGAYHRICTTGKMPQPSPQTTESLLRFTILFIFDLGLRGRGLTNGLVI